MIKLAVISMDEESEERILKCLQGQKDLMVKGFVVLRNVAHDVEKGAAFLNKMVAAQPEIVIVDILLLREAAALHLKSILEFQKKCTGMRAIIIGDRFNEQNVIVTMKGGARGFVLRDNLDAHLVKCIHAVAKGEIWLCAEMLSLACNELIRECDEKNMPKDPTDSQLAKMQTVSRREKEVMALICESMTNEEIAEKLFLSAKTVKTHIRNIFEKTGIRNRVEAALLYLRYKHENENG
jgi:two-component system, NarL family, response regulator DegU